MVLGEMRDLCCWVWDWDWEDDFFDGFSGSSEEEYRHRGHCQLPNYQKRTRNRKKGKIKIYLNESIFNDFTATATDSDWV